MLHDAALTWPLRFTLPALQLLDFDLSFKTWNSVHFLGHFLMVAIIVVSMVNPPRKQRKKEAATADKHDQTGQAAPPIQSGEPINPLPISKMPFPAVSAALPRMQVLTCLPEDVSYHAVRL